MPTVLKRKSLEGAKFTAEGGGWVKLRLMGSDDFDDINEQTMEPAVEYPKLDGEFRRFEYERINTKLRNELFWDKCIQDFGDWVDEKGKPYPCTRENKTFLMKEFEEFSSLVNDGIKKLTEDRKKKVEAQEKN